MSHESSAVPIRATSEWEREENTNPVQVTIHRPRQPRNRLDRFLLDLFDTPTDRELTLDAVGSRVWLDCDGTMTIAEIAADLDASFADERVSPVEDTLPYFLLQLDDLELIRYEEG